MLSNAGCPSTLPVLSCTLQNAPVPCPVLRHTFGIRACLVPKHAPDASCLLARRPVFSSSPDHSCCRRPVPQMRQLASLPSDHACISTSCARNISSSSSACHASAAASNTSTRGHPRLQAAPRYRARSQCLMHAADAQCHQARSQSRIAARTSLAPVTTQASLTALPQRLHLLQAQGPQAAQGHETEHVGGASCMLQLPNATEHAVSQTP